MGDNKVKATYLAAVAATSEFTTPTKGKAPRAGGSLEGTIGLGICIPKLSISDYGCSRKTDSEYNRVLKRGTMFVMGPAAFVKGSFFKGQNKVTFGGKFSAGYRFLNLGVLGGYSWATDGLKKPVVGFEIAGSVAALAILGGRYGTWAVALGAPLAPTFNIQVLFNPKTAASKDWTVNFGLGWRF